MFGKEIQCPLWASLGTSCSHIYMHAGKAHTHTLKINSFKNEYGFLHGRSWLTGEFWTLLVAIAFAAIRKIIDFAMVPRFGFSAWFCLVGNSFTLILLNPVQPCPWLSGPRPYPQHPWPQLSVASTLPCCDHKPDELTIFSLLTSSPVLPLCSCSPRILCSAHF